MPISETDKNLKRLEGIAIGDIRNHNQPQLRRILHWQRRLWKAQEAR